jgi:heme o synthase
MPITSPLPPVARPSAPVRGREPSAGEHTTGSQRAGTAATIQTRSGAAQRLRDYVTLTKPHVISLLLVTTIGAMVVAAGGWPAWGTLAAVLLGGYLMAGGANAVNMWWDRDIDARMGRTSLRPIPAGRMAPGHVLAYGVALATTAFALLALVANLAAAVLALAGFAYYVGIYTVWLKRRSPQNIVIGGAAGAVPPLVGWVAVTGALSPLAVGMFLVIFLWTPPHFWALALVKRPDYARVGVPMAPNAWGPGRTMAQMGVYAVLLVAATLALALDPALGLVYAASAAGLGAWFLRGVVRLPRAVAFDREAWKVYRGSLLYLALLFGAMMLDVAVGRML